MRSEPSNVTLNAFLPEDRGCFLVQFHGLVLPDWRTALAEAGAQMQESARKLATLPVDVLCFGHGEAIVKGVDKKLQALLKPQPD
jgi:hypothetical protein